MPQQLVVAQNAHIIDFEEAIAATAPKCILQHYENQRVPSFTVSGWFQPFSSPDSIFFVLKSRLEAARSSILIGMYDFSVEYVNTLLKAALARGVRVTMMLDLAPNDKDASAIFGELIQLGAKCVLAPSCRNFAKAHYFFVCHEKVIVIDEEITFVQSGNFSQGSTPDNPENGVVTPGFKTGYRDMGVVVQSRSLAQFFVHIITSDMTLEESAEHPQRNIEVTMAVGTPSPFLAVLPPEPPTQLFPSRLFTPTTGVSVQPLLSPDDYMEVVPEAIAAAQESILIEQQYIHAQQNLVSDLCAAIKRARSAHPSLDVRIIVAPPFTNTPKDRDSLARDLKALADTFNLATGTNVRLLTHRFFAHLHNKLVILDHQRVLVSSQNWSSTGVSRNREAGLLIDYPELSQHYADIFEFDWNTADKSIEEVVPQTLVMPAVAAIGVVESIPRDTFSIHVLPGDLADV